MLVSLNIPQGIKGACKVFGLEFKEIMINSQTRDKLRTNFNYISGVYVDYEGWNHLSLSCKKLLYGLAFLHSKNKNIWYSTKDICGIVYSYKEYSKVNLPS